MANTAFNHDPALTVAASNTTAGAAVKWVASKNLGESLIILDSGGNGRIGLAGDLDLITLTSGTVTVAGTVSATLVGGAAVKDEDNMASDSATHLASQQSIKAYVDANGGPSQADQAAIEAETNQDTYVPPDLIKHSPGVAKAYCSVASDGTLQSNSYNVTSYARNSTGNYTVTWATDFANTNYSAHVNAEDSSYFARAGVPATGTQAVNIRNTSGVAADSAHNITAFGDQ